MWATSYPHHPHLPINVEMPRQKSLPFYFYFIPFHYTMAEIVGCIFF